MLGIQMGYYYLQRMYQMTTHIQSESYIGVSGGVTEFVRRLRHSHATVLLVRVPEGKWPTT